jgi:hypothetical protein
MRDANTGYTPLYCVGRNTRLTKVTGTVSPLRIGHVDRRGPRMKKRNSPMPRRRAVKPLSFSNKVCAEHRLGQRRLTISALIDADAGRIKAVQSNTFGTQKMISIQTMTFSDLVDNLSLYRDIAIRIHSVKTAQSPQQPRLRAGNGE